MGKAGVCQIARRDTSEKTAVSLSETVGAAEKLLKEIQANMLAQATEFLNSHIKVVSNTEELFSAVENKNFAKTMWCGDRACEEKIKEIAQATSRVMPFDQTPVGDKCVCCGKKADKVIYFARAY